MRVAIFSPNMDGGGVWSVTQTLCAALVARGYAVDLVIGRFDANQTDAAPQGVEVFALAKSSYARGLFSMVRAFPGELGCVTRACLERRGAMRQSRVVADLARYLRRRQPDVLIANLWHCGVASVRARALAGAATRIVTVAHSDNLDDLWRHHTGPSSRRSTTARLIGRLHARADARVAVSASLARAFEHAASLAPHSVQTIYNPVVDSSLLERARLPVAHPWFRDTDTPVILGVGRLVPPKAFDVLVEAFARVRRRRRVRLVILGDGPERARLEAQASNAGLGDDIAFMGWVPHPVAFMARSAMLVSASRFEGLSLVLIEALACGCPVVSTDCPSGPAEVLGNGRYGRLVAVDDVAALSQAIEETLDAPPAKALLQQRAADFSVDNSVDLYERLITELQAPQPLPGPAAKPVPAT